MTEPDRALTEIKERLSKSASSLAGCEGGSLMDWGVCTTMLVSIRPPVGTCSGLPRGGFDAEQSAAHKTAGNTGRPSVPDCISLPLHALGDEGQSTSVGSQAASKVVWPPAEHRQ